MPPAPSQDHVVLLRNCTSGLSVVLQLKCLTTCKHVTLTPSLKISKLLCFHLSTCIIPGNISAVFSSPAPSPARSTIELGWDNGVQALWSILATLRKFSMTNCLDAVRGQLLVLWTLCWNGTVRGYLIVKSRVHPTLPSTQEMQLSK